MTVHFNFNTGKEIVFFCFLHPVNRDGYIKANLSTVEDLKIDINVIKLCKGCPYLFHMEHQFVKIGDCQC